MPEPVRLFRDKGWRKPAGSLKVDRSTPWGNPFKLLKPLGRGGSWRVAFTGPGRPSWAGEVEGRFPTEAEAADVAVGAFRRWLGETEQAELVRRARRELRGKDLACWCPLDQPCHRSIWLELANAGEAPPAEVRPGRGRPKGG